MEKERANNDALSGRVNGSIHSAKKGVEFTLRARLYLI